MIVLHAIGGGSIPPEGTVMVRTIPHRKGSAIGDNRQGVGTVSKTVTGKFDSYGLRQGQKIYFCDIYIK